MGAGLSPILWHAIGVPARPTRTEREASAGTAWFLAGYVGVVGFFVVETAVRERGMASSLTVSADDQDSTRMIVAASVLAASLSPLLRRIPLHPLPKATAPAGLALEAAGLAVRVWSMRTLRASYSRTLRTRPEQPVVDRGPYRVIRHPGYLGSLITWSGFALTSRNVPVLIAVTGSLFLAYSHRIRAEETLLRRELPGYLDYCRGTKKLIPFVW